MVTEDDVHSLNIQSLQKLIMKLLHIGDVQRAVASALSNEEISTTHVVTLGNNTPRHAKKSNSTILKDKLVEKYNFLTQDDTALLEGELQSIPYETNRLKPASFLMSNLNKDYGKHTPSSTFEPYKIIQKALKKVNEKTGQNHNCSLIQRFGANSTLNWQGHENELLAKSSAVTILSIGLGGARTMEFCPSKSQNSGRCACYHTNLIHNSVITLPSEVREKFLIRVPKPCIKDKDKFLYSIYFLTMKDELFTPIPESSIRPASESITPIVLDDSLTLTSPESPITLDDANAPSHKTPPSVIQDDITPPTTSPVHEPTSNFQSINISNAPTNIPYRSPNNIQNRPSGKEYNYDERNPQNEALALANSNNAFIKYNNTPFISVSFDDLDKSTDYTHNFNNRRCGYYGEAPYSYSNVTHSARPISDNSILAEIVKKAKDEFPQENYNAAMVHRYDDGHCYIPYHSDNEKQIKQNSTILTLSFGQSRLMSFRRRSDRSDVSEIMLTNGDMIIMSRLSQDYFSHSIPADPTCKNPRISVTLWNIPISQADSKSQASWNASQVHPSRKPSKSVQDEKCTLLLGDSILSRVTIKDGNTLNKCIRGANLDKVLNTLKTPDFKSSVQSHHIGHIFICVGTNDLSSGSNITTVLLTYKRLLHALRSLFPDAQINVMNIFPRKDVNGLGEKVCRVNNGLFHMCKSFKIKFIKYFFSFIENGCLKNELFHTDLLHLSALGLEMVKKCIIECKSQIITRQ